MADHDPRATCGVPHDDHDPEHGHKGKAHT
jgi:hypothetical protein